MKLSYKDVLMWELDKKGFLVRTTAGKRVLKHVLKLSKAGATVSYSERLVCNDKKIIGTEMTDWKAVGPVGREHIETIRADPFTMTRIVRQVYRRDEREVWQARGFKIFADIEITN